MENENRPTHQRNWIQRHLIQYQQAELRQNNSHSQEGEQEDPLLPIKYYYYQLYTQEIGQPGVPIESSPIYQSVAQQISQLVDTAVKQVNQFYIYHQSLIKQLPPNSHSEMEQYLNRMTAEYGRIDENIIEATVRCLADPDSLVTSKAGKLLRKIVPSKRQKELKEVVAKGKKELATISKEFIEEMIRKYRS